MSPEPPANRPGSTSAQLRDDIDSGRTGDKVRLQDPAAAPLGTDDEAAGAPPSPADVEEARRREGGKTGGDQSSVYGPAAGNGLRWSAPLVVMALAVIVVLVGIGLVLILS